MIAQNEPQKWEYKALNIQSHRTPSPAELTTAAKVTEILNADGQGNWELISTIHQVDNILPEGFVVLKRVYQAPKAAVRGLFSTSKKPIVALSPTAGKTDAKVATA